LKNGSSVALLSKLLITIIINNNSSKKKKKKLEKSDRRQTLVLKRISLPSSCTQYKQVNTTIYTTNTTTHTVDTTLCTIRDGQESTGRTIAHTHNMCRTCIP
jgi:hypothetical protein